MPIAKRHGRQGQATEYYEWVITPPKVIVQRYGEQWMIAIDFRDGTCRVIRYFCSLEQASRHAKRLAQALARELPDRASTIRMARLVAGIQPSENAP